MSATVRVYQVTVSYPEGALEPGWRPAVWLSGPWRDSLTRKQRRELDKREFRWPRRRRYLSSSGAYAMSDLLRWYGAWSEVHASLPVTWPEVPDDWELGETAAFWSADYEQAGRRLEAKDRAAMRAKLLCPAPRGDEGPQWYELGGVLS